MQIAGEHGKAARRVGISIRAHGDVQLAGAYINADSIWRQDRQRVTSAFALRAIYSFDHAGRTPGARTENILPIEIVVRNR
jgi:hypothetical protein